MTEGLKNHKITTKNKNFKEEIVMRALSNKWRQILALFVAITMLGSLALKVEATDSANSAVTEDTKGVICILVVYQDDARNLIPIQSGTGFLINDQTVVTCDHVVTLDDETIGVLQEMYGKSTSEIKDRTKIQIIVNRDVTIGARVQVESAEVDYAILQLESRLYDRTYLPLRHSSEVSQTEIIYALGFPGQVGRFQDVNTYTTDDVTVTNGQVNKVNRLANNVEYVQHSATLNSGNSGGPLVDRDGYVVGINAFTTGDIFEENYFYAIAIDQLIATMDSLGIEYTIKGGPDVQPTTAPVPTIAADPTPAIGNDETGRTLSPSVDKTELGKELERAKDVDSSKYTSDSYAELKSAIKDAEKVNNDPNATAADVSDAIDKLAEANEQLQTASAFPIWLVIVIAAVVILVIVIILIVALGGKKKPAAPSYSAPAYNPGVSPAAPAARAPISGFNAASATPSTNFMSSSVGAGETSVLSAGAGETTVLNAGAGETTVLNSNINLGTLTRVKSGERITINSDNFVIGKELSKVNYCVSDNTSISRTHARFSGRGGVTYITDLKTTNGTFLNGVKLQPNQENPLKNGDKISLADEEFTFSA